MLSKSNSSKLESQGRSMRQGNKDRSPPSWRLHSVSLCSPEFQSQGMCNRPLGKSLTLGIGLLVFKKQT